MNKFALTTVAALPGRGAGVESKLHGEVPPANENPDYGAAFEPTVEVTLQLPESMQKRIEEFPTFEVWEQQKKAEKLLGLKKVEEDYFEKRERIEAESFESVKEHLKTMGITVTRDDPYADVKAAYAKWGHKGFEFKGVGSTEWRTWGNYYTPSFDSPPECYRVTPGLEDYMAKPQMTEQETIDKIVAASKKLSW